MKEFRTASLAVSVSDEAKIAGFALLAEQRDILGGRTPLLRIRLGERCFDSCRAEFPADGTLRVTFDTVPHAVELAVKADSLRITFTVTRVSGDPVPDELILADIPVTFRGIAGDVVGLVRGERTTVGIQGLNWFTDAGVWDSEGRFEPYNGALIVPDGDVTMRTVEDRSRLYASAVRPAGLVGARWALFACPTADCLDVLERIEREEPGLPHLTDENGVWMRRSPELRKAYIVPYDMGRQKMDVYRVLDYAVRGGFSYLYFGDPTWSKTWGHFLVNDKNFPGGDEGLRAFAQFARQRGVKLGFHTLSGTITTSDPYVSPVPDPRLSARGAGRLERSVSPEETAEILAGGISGEFCHQDRFYSGAFVDEKGGEALPGGAFVVGQEIVRCARMAVNRSEGTVALRDLTRGAYGTRPAAHQAGETIRRLREEWCPGNLFPDVDSSLVEEMAARLAELANFVPLSMTSFDGWEALGYNGGYGCERFLHEVCRRWDHPMVASASRLSHFSWHAFPQYNAGEPTYDVRADMERRTRYRNFVAFEKNLYLPGVGWQWFKSNRWDHEASTPDEIEYLFAKAAGFRYPCALSFEQWDLDAHGETDRMLAATAAWQKAMEADAFSEDQRARMRQKGTDFHLEHSGQGRWKLTQQKWARRAWLKLDGQAAFTADNPFQPQFPLMVVRGLSRFDRSHPANIALPLREMAFEPRGKQDPNAPEMRVEKAPASVRLLARRKGPEYPSVVTMDADFPSVQDFSAHHGMGLEVEGDGSGALLFLELVDQGAQVRQYYWRLDFVGRRWLELPCGEARMEEYYDHVPWNYAYSHWSWALKWYSYNRVRSVRLGLNELLPDTATQCAILSAQMLSDIREPIDGLSLCSPSGVLIFSCALKPDEFLRVEPDGSSGLYDLNWHRIGAVQPQGSLPKAETGPNEWKIKANGQPGNWVSVRLCFSRPPEDVPA